MTDKPEPATTPPNAGDLRGQLVKRLAVAGVLVAVLLGMLAFFDYLARAPQDDADDGPVFSRPVPVAPKKEVSQPVKPATDLPEPPAEPAPAAPASEPPPAPQVAPPTAPVVDESKPETKPAPRAESRAASRSTAAVARTAPPSPPPVAEETASPAMTPRQEAPAPVVARPSARVVDAAPAAAPVAPQPSLTRLLSGFLLQAGVFTSPKSAEELHARLTLSGVPSTLETRVQVGPFRTRQEAEAAQQKLKALGVETILVPPTGAKR